MASRDVYDMQLKKKRALSGNLGFRCVEFCRNLSLGLYVKKVQQIVKICLCFFYW